MYSEAKMKSRFCKKLYFIWKLCWFKVPYLLYVAKISFASRDGSYFSEHPWTLTLGAARPIDPLSVYFFYMLKTDQKLHILGKQPQSGTSVSIATEIGRCDVDNGQ